MATNRYRSMCFFLSGALLATGQGAAGCQNQVPPDVVRSWDAIAASRPKDSVTSSVERNPSSERVIWDQVIKVLGENMLLEIRTMNGTPMNRTLVRGPKYKFVIERSEGAQNCLDLVSQGEELEKEQDGLFDRAANLLNASHAIYNVPLKEFFNRCAVVLCSQDRPELLRIAFKAPADGNFPVWKECTNIEGEADFDAKLQWRLVRLNYRFKNPRGIAVDVTETVRYDPTEPSKYEIEVSDTKSGVVAWRTHVTPMAKTPTLAEFLPETYGIQITAVVERWWQRPTVWLGFVALMCLGLAAWFRRRAKES